MKPSRRGIVLGPVLVFAAAALNLLPVWAGVDHGAAPTIAASLFILLASVSVPGPPILARHRH